MATEPRQLALADLFARKLFRVPDYQRGYAWTRPQLEDLWHDIDLLDGRNKHFTGMIVVKPLGEHYDDAAMEHCQILEVIDGQQRLTTLVLLFQAICRAMRAEGPEGDQNARKLDALYVGRRDQLRLALNSDSRTWFEQLLARGEPLPHVENGSQKNLLDAHRFFLRRLDDWLPREERLAALAHLVRRLQSSLRFVYYEVEDDAEAGLIFEVMNNRGKELSQADLVKNYLLYVARKVAMAEDAVNGIAARWGEVFKQVMRAVPDGGGSTEAEDRLLRNHWVLYKEAQPPKELRGLSISQRIRKDLELRPLPEGRREPAYADLGRRALRYTDSLLATAHDFAEVCNPDAPDALTWIGNEDIRRRAQDELRSFTRMDHQATALPLLLAGCRKLHDEAWLFLKLARALSVYAFRVYALVRRRSNAGQAQFRRLARELYAVRKAQLVPRGTAIVDEIRAWTR